MLFVVRWVLIHALFPSRALYANFFHALIHSSSSSSSCCNPSTRTYSSFPTLSMSSTSWSCTTCCKSYEGNGSNDGDQPQYKCMWNEDCYCLPPGQREIFCSTDCLHKHFIDIHPDRCCAVCGNTPLELEDCTKRTKQGHIGRCGAWLCDLNACHKQHNQTVHPPTVVATATRTAAADATA